MNMWMMYHYIQYCNSDFPAVLHVLITDYSELWVADIPYSGKIWQGLTTAKLKSANNYFPVTCIRVHMYDNTVQYRITHNKI